MPTDLPTVTQALQAHFLAEWGDECPVTFLNEVFTASDTWVRMSVDELVEDQRTLGGEGARKWDHRCQVVVQVFFPAEGSSAEAGGGMNPGLVLADAVRAIFRGKSIGAAKFAGVTVGRATVDPDNGGRWRMLRVVAPFYFLEIA